MTLNAAKKSLAEVTENFQNVNNIQQKISSIQQSMSKNYQLSQESSDEQDEEGEQTPIESEEEDDNLEHKLNTVRSRYDKQREDLKNKLPSELEELRIQIADLK